MTNGDKLLQLEKLLKQKYTAYQKAIKSKIESELKNAKAEWINKLNFYAEFFRDSGDNLKMDYHPRIADKC